MNKVVLHKLPTISKLKDKKNKTSYIINFSFMMVDEKGEIVLMGGEKYIRKRSKNFSTKKEADNNIAVYKDRFICELEEKYTPDIVINDLLEEFMKVYAEKKEWKKSTIRTHRDIVKNQLKPYFEGCTLKMLPNKVNGFKEYVKHLTYLKGKKVYELSNNRKKQVVSTMYNFLNFLEEEKYTEDNYKKYLGRGRIPRESSRKVEITFEEYQQFLDIGKRLVVDDAVIDACTLMFLTGLRRGECLGLQYGDINLEIGELKVQRTYDSNTKYDTPKTFSSIRRVKLISQVIELLKPYMENIARENQNNPDINSIPIFCKNGMPYAQSTFGYHFRKIRNEFKKETGIELRIHDLRRSFATNMAEIVPDATMIQQLMGHSSPTTTSEVYMVLDKRKIRKEYLEKYSKKAEMNLKR